MSNAPAPSNNEPADLFARNLFWITVVSAASFIGVVLVFVLR